LSRDGQKVRAAVLEAVGQPLVVDDLEILPPQEAEVAIRVVASGLCHSDYSTAHGILRSPVPVVLGHEAAGIVEAIGPGVDHVSVGDAVIASLTPACGTCPMCVEDKPFLCFQMGPTMSGSTLLDGTTRLRRGDEVIHQVCGIASFAQRAVIPAGMAIPVPADAPLDQVCLIGCGVTTGLGAVFNTARVEPGTSVAVVGCGGVGLSIVQGCRLAGATNIIAVDPQAEKRELAESLGATHSLDPGADDVNRAVRKITRFGVHYAFEAIGRTDTIEQCWSLLRPTGIAVVVGMPRARDTISLRAGGFFQQKQITGSVYGSADPRRDIPHYVELHRRGDLNLDALITQRIGLDDLNDALAAMGRGEGARSVVVFD
jgi:S-(hydroxymethyl)glutathione dehydrogenase/alcohol dehydrogenase